MFKNLVRALTVVAVLLSGVAYAANGTFNTTNLRVANTGWVTVYIAYSSTVNCNYAGDTSASWLVFDSTTAGGKSMLSIVTAARLAGKSLFIEYNPGPTGSGTNCQINSVQF